MNRQFFDPNNEDYLYQTVRDKIIRDKQVDIDVNSNFKNMMSKLMNQVYQSKQDKTIDELNDICSNSINLFFVNIIDKKIKKHETKNNNEHSSIQDTAKMEDNSKNDDNFFRKLYDVLNSDEDNSELAEHFQGSGPSVSSKTQTVTTLVEKKDNNNTKQLLSNILSVLKSSSNKQTGQIGKNRLIILDVLNSTTVSAAGKYAFYNTNDKIENITCTLESTQKLVGVFEVYLEFLSLHNIKLGPGAEYGSHTNANIEVCHTFLLNIDGLDLENNGILSNISEFTDSTIVIPNETYGYNDNAYDEDVGSEGGATGDTSTNTKYTSHVYRLKSNYVGTVNYGNGKDLSKFVVTLRGQFRGLDVNTTEVLVAASDNGRVQIGLVFKQI
jgi:hypothetical protein